MLAQADEEEADLVVFPELSLTGYSVGQVSEDVSLEAVGEDIAPLLEGHRAMAVVVGLSEAGRLHTYNSAAYIEDGAVRHLHRKLYLPTYGAFEDASTSARARRCGRSTPASGPWPCSSATTCGSRCCPSSRCRTGHAC